jgi:hypothetical protein
MSDLGALLSSRQAAPLIVAGGSLLLLVLASQVVVSPLIRGLLSRPWLARQRLLLAKPASLPASRSNSLVVLWLSPALLVARFLVVLHLALTTRRRANLVVCACQLVPAQAVLLVLSS